jgi:hypothetical protein
MEQRLNRKIRDNPHTDDMAPVASGGDLRATVTRM